AVNDNGIVVGYSSLPGNTATHAFVWTRDGGIIDIGTLDGRTSLATAVNESGTIVGVSALGEALGDHAFVWTEAGGLIDLGTLGGRTSAASAVNNSGTIVGDSDTVAGTRHPTAWNLPLPRTTTITWPTPSDIVYGTPLGPT